MKKLGFLFSVVFLSFGFSISWAQTCQSVWFSSKPNAEAQLLCPEIMINDLVYLEKTLQETHPNLYLYCSETDFRNAYKKAVQAASTDKSTLQFSLIIADFLSILSDSHTNINPRDLLFMQGRKRLIYPMIFKQINNDFYFEKTLFSQFPTGTKVLKMNGLSADSLYNLTLRFSLAEGNSTVAKQEMASKMMGIVFNLFSRSEKMEVVGILPKGDTLTSTVYPMTIKAFNKLNNWYADESTYYFFDKDENRAVLVIPSFEPRILLGYYKTLDNFFEEVKSRKCEEVIIDLRDNRGGLIRAQEYLISFLNVKHEKINMEYLYKRSNHDRFEQLPFYQKWQFTRMAERADTGSIIKREFRFFQSPMGTVEKIDYVYLPRNTKNNLYNGKTTLIVNGLSMSASAMFAAWFRLSERGKIVGNQCMGTPSGTFGNGANIYLPNTGIPILISTLKFTPKSVGIQVEPINPDQKIDHEPADLVKQTDPVFRFLHISPPTALTKKRN